MFKTIYKVLTRKKVLDAAAGEETRLGRVLNTFDLTALGVGSTLGVGVYVLAGHVAKDVAGPAVVLSFLIATVASVFAGLCYAEFGARAPRAGSAYIYSYVCIGEFVAFVIGWNLVLEYVIGSASVARGLSLYLDTLLNHTMEEAFIDVAPIDAAFMSKYFDFFAFGIAISLSVALAFGMKESSIVNNIFTILNLAIVLFVIIAGAIKADTKNWNLTPPANRTDAGKGGFFPFGVEGMIKGAATCFYGFVGFDCIATTGEEVKNPRRAIPFSIIFSLLIIFLAYFGTSTVVTLMLPYYDQDPNAPIPHAFESLGWIVPMWIVSIGGIFGLCASLFGAMFPLPRILYAMASDGIIFEFLGRVSERFRTPVVGTLLAGLLTGLMGALFDLGQLVNMMSIGTLLAYTIVAASVLLLRYKVEKGAYQPIPTSDDDDNDYTENTNFNEVTGHGINDVNRSVDCEVGYFRQIFNCGRNELPTSVSERLVTIEVCIYCILCVCIGLCAIYLNGPIIDGEIWAIVLTSIVVCATVLVIMSIATQPKSAKELTFKVPMVPLIPALSILINIYLMLMLDPNTWVRFGVWMAIGLPTYYLSVKNQSKCARNHHIPNKYSSSSISSIQNGHKNYNGNINFAFTNNEPLPITNNNENNKKTITSISTIEPEEAIAHLENVIRRYDNELQTEAPNLSQSSQINADVHRPDTPSSPSFPTPLPCVIIDPPSISDELHHVIEREPIVLHETKIVDVSPPLDVIRDTPPSSPEPPLLHFSKEHVVIPRARVSGIPPPPPPPVHLLSDAEVDDLVPKPPPHGTIGFEINLETLRSVKLKKRADLPQIEQQEVQEKDDEKMVYDRKSQKFRDALSETLVQNMTRRIIEESVKVKRANSFKNVELISETNGKNDNVDDDNIDVNDAKKKLLKLNITGILHVPSSLPESPVKVEGVSLGVSSNVSPKLDETKEVDENDGNDNVDDDNIDLNVAKKKLMMLNILHVPTSSPRSTVKVEGVSLEATPNSSPTLGETSEEEEQPRKSDVNDLELHNRNMQNIFNSIRLKKYDADESQQ